MANVAKRGAKARDKGGMTEPPQNNAANNQENQEVFGVQRKIIEVFDHRKARADQGSIDDAIGDIIKFVTQDDEQQKQAKTFNGFFGDACVESLEDDMQNFTGLVGIKGILQIGIDILFNE